MPPATILVKQRKPRHPGRISGARVEASCPEAPGERFATPEGLKKLVAEGHLGTKSGGGFVIPAGDTTDLVAYRNTAYARLQQLLAELGEAPGVK